ncbi:MAG: aminopeptidase P N-terminal domain-containing protein [Gemmatimonadetes bacterium]|nr:aminopeptidase P N-terminal domain-containing protein [Gemmatimonadota bacterium]
MRVRLVLALLLGSATALAAQVPEAEYAARRDSVAARLGDGVIVAFGGREPVTDYTSFYQLPAFRYLTGFLEPDAALVLVSRGGRAEARLYTAAVPPRRQVYYGFVESSAALEARTGMRVRPLTSLEADVDSLLASGLPLYELRDYEAADFARQDSLTRGGRFVERLKAAHPGLEVRDAHDIVNRLRARRSVAELALVRRAVEITVEAQREALAAIRPGMHEYEVQALIESVFRRRGAERPAFASIVGSGPNSTTLHYFANRREMREGDVVVMDIGASYGGYAADVTRTVPVSGRFTPEQRAIYQLVRDAQAAAERNARPGLSAVASTDSAVAVRLRGLARLGLIESPEATFDPPWPADCARDRRACLQGQLFMIHGISHGIGLETHDPAQFYFDDRTFKPGDAFTIEPGIYISERLLDLLPDTPRNRAFAAKVRATVRKYEGIGVRIEDDYIVTEGGTEWVSRAPREIDEIERLMAARRPKA